MRKQFFMLCCMAVLCALPATAQRYFMLGPKASFSVNRFEDLQKEDGIDFQQFNTASGGLFARVNLGSLYLQPEAYFLVKGANYSMADEVRSTGKIRLNTIETPVLLGFYLLNGETLNLRAFGGPVFNLYTKEAQNDLKTLDPQRYAFDKKVNNFQAGIGADILMFTVDARYEWALNRASEDLGVKQRQFLISLGYKLFEH